MIFYKKVIILKKADVVLLVFYLCVSMCYITYLYHNSTLVIKLFNSWAEIYILFDMLIQYTHYPTDHKAQFFHTLKHL